MMMQPYMTIIGILVCRNYSVFDEPHFLKKLRGNLRLFLLGELIFIVLHQMYQGKTEESEYFA